MVRTLVPKNEWATEEPRETTTLTVQILRGSDLLEQFEVECGDWQPHKVAAEIRHDVETARGGARKRRKKGRRP